MHLAGNTVNAVNDSNYFAPIRLTNRKIIKITVETH